MKKIVFSDLDGTLVDHHFTVTDEINRKIEQLDARFVIATGRMYDTAKDLNINVPADMICSNGSEVTINQELVYQKTMDKKQSLDLIKHLLNERMYINVYTTSGVYVPYFEGLNTIIMGDTYRYAKSHSKSVDDFKRNIGAHLDLFYYTNEIVDNIEDILETGDVIKLEIVFCMDIVEKTNELEELYDVNAYSSFGNNLEIVPLGITKVHGITKYLEMTETNNYTSFAIGDGHNDIEMIKYADVGIAMGNACYELKQHADFIVANQDEGGMLEALEIIKNYQK